LVALASRSLLSTAAPYLIVIHPSSSAASSPTKGQQRLRLRLLSSRPPSTWLLKVSRREQSLFSLFYFLALSDLRVQNS
jgi:hypothetical protein